MGALCTPAPAPISHHPSGQDSVEARGCRLLSSHKLARARAASALALTCCYASGRGVVPGGSSVSLQRSVGRAGWRGFARGGFPPPAASALRPLEGDAWLCCGLRFGLSPASTFSPFSHLSLQNLLFAFAAIPVRDRARSLQSHGQMRGEGHRSAQDVRADHDVWRDVMSKESERHVPSTAAPRGFDL